MDKNIKYSRVEEEFEIVYRLGEEKKGFSLRSAMMNVDDLIKLEQSILIKEINDLRLTMRPMLKFAKENLAHGGMWCKQVCDAETLLDVCSCSPHHTREEQEKNFCEPCKKPILGSIKINA